MDFLKQPDVTIVQALLLRFRPVNMDVLPLYIVLMLFLPLILWLMKWKADVTLALSVLLYAATWQYDLYLSAYPNGVWAFNPLAWQLLFVFGAWCSQGGAKRMSRILSSKITLWISLAYLFAAFCVTLTWYLPQLSFLMPRWLEQWMYPIDKTDLDVLRFAHFLALAAGDRAFPAQGLALAEIALAAAIGPVRAALAGDILPRRVSGVRGALHPGRGPRRRRAARHRQRFRNRYHVRRGLVVFVVQALRRQRCVADKKHHRQRGSGRGKLMRSGAGAVLAVVGTLLAGVLTVVSARAEEAVTAPQSCDVPAYLLASDSPLPKVAAAVKAGHPLNILVIGSRSSTIPSSEASAYPARLQAMLKEKLPSVAVNLSVELLPKQTSEEVVAGLVKLMEDKKPTLVIWQTGTVDAMRSIDPDDFRSAVDDGRCCDAKGGNRRDPDEPAI